MVAAITRMTSRPGRSSSTMSWGEGTKTSNLERQANQEREVHQIDLWKYKSISTVMTIAATSHIVFSLMLADELGNTYAIKTDILGNHSV
ncbi:predicted protein [Lichtheimia corymbifera JMRC:FSU:9682]|uniref:Uncharacterized protein n=1 Tax=Lichtheimia corymbifera JMRC:FSU:9682 TaxID=1263082 RepID=A0A068S748_9FUNG|nr:predicted protein [Lichtheimia corymbifera JMRC:FSU:9682]